MNEYRLAIIGGGAAGMMAAVSASRIFPGKEIVIIEKNPILGRKISATGNGRCNFSNRNCNWQDYNDSGKYHVRETFKYLDPEKTVQLFRKLGVLAREETEGRLYPYSEQASSIIIALEDEIKHKEVDILVNAPVSKIEKEQNQFIVSINEQIIRSDRIIIATGGKAGLRFGSTGDGYGFAKGFGHTLKRPLPALVQIITNDDLAYRLKGVRAKGVVSLKKGKECISREKGEIQFTKDGVSGICIFNLTRYLGERPTDFQIDIDLFPEHSLEEIVQLFLGRAEDMADRSAYSILNGLLNDKLAPVYLEITGINLDTPIRQIEKKKLISLAKSLKSREISIKGTKGWVEAQVTTGGINCEEVAGNLESKLIPSLFFSGEVLDIDGKCGGWNLQWAWSSGYAAGFYAASKK